MVSVIVPVYNAEKSLEKCISSILEQTYRDVELILVDDGSTDQSGKICAVLTQQVVTNARLATPEEIRNQLEHLGFHAEDNGEYFTNGIHDVFDAVPNNVLVDNTGHIFFIDTIIFKSDSDGIDTYKKYSPNYSKS